MQGAGEQQIAFDDFRVVRQPHRVTTGQQIPSCLFTDAELPSVGLSEREAKECGSVLPPVEVASLQPTFAAHLPECRLLAKRTPNREKLG